MNDEVVVEAVVGAEAVVEAEDEIANAAAALDTVENPVSMY